jgi:uncharacterized protein (DUF1330 family)
LKSIVVVRVPPASAFVLIQGRNVMKTQFKIGLAVAVGAALGAVVVQGLHAQAKPKAYSVTETEVLDPAAQATYTPKIQAAQKAAPGNARNFQTAGGRVIALEGGAPKRIGITEWDSAEQAQAFYNSKAYKDLEPDRNKAVKTIRRFVVEARQ